MHSIARGRRALYRKRSLAFVGRSRSVAAMLAGFGGSQDDSEDRRAALVGRLAVLRGLVDEGEPTAEIAADIIDEARHRCKGANLAAEIVSIANGRRMIKLHES